MNKTRPFLKWAGNKYYCLETLLDLFPQGSRLIEPFTGAATLFLNTSYPEYLLAENNPDLIHLYQNLREGGDEFIAYCQKWFTGRYNTPEWYYHWRDIFNRTRNTRRRAALFLYLNRHGYNGLCRYNASRKYNVPFGRYRKPYFPTHEMQLFHRKDHRTAFVCEDFRQTFQQATAGDVIYCDPPYAPLKQETNFTSYSGKKFTELDQCDLARLAIETANRGITVIISNHDTAFTRAQYHLADIRTCMVPRMINCKTQERHPVRELIAIFRG